MFQIIKIWCVCYSMSFYLFYFKCFSCCMKSLIIFRANGDGDLTVLLLPTNLWFNLTSFPGRACCLMPDLKRGNVHWERGWDWLLMFIQITCSLSRSAHFILFLNKLPYWISPLAHQRLVLTKKVKSQSFPRNVLYSPVG